MKIFTKLIVFAHILLLISIFSPSANSIEKQEAFIDNTGKEFFFTFMPNYHSRNSLTNKDDSLYVFITSEKKTIGKIKFKSRGGLTQNRYFSIDSGGQTKIFRFAPYNSDLLTRNLPVRI